ncbi:germ cell nuclear acidic protein [Cavia porcellus]|uniref:germ cell nuclear acidic protein n=1 Tax=Cavia porcellus TaxID=10141 RepID=UPI002FE13EAB
MDKSEEKPGQFDRSLSQDDCYIVNVSSSNNENSESTVVRKAVQKRQVSPVVIDSESDDEYAHEEKKIKIYEINSQDEVLAVISDTEEEDKEEEEELEVEEVEMEEPTTNTQKSPVVIVIDDDDDDDDGNNKKWEIPELKEGDSHNYSQIYSYKREVHESVASQQNSPDNVPLGNDPEANLEIIDQELPTTDKLISVTEQPRKRKTSKTCVAPADSGRKNQASSEKKASAAKADKCKTGRAVCQIPGCFLLDIEKLKQYSGKNFKKNKDELVQRIYTLLNNTIFDQKLPEEIDITWNKKMLRTAGSCTTSERQYPKRERYVKIEISLKVCDSADRLRDTLIHEMCHAASWLIDGIRDSHGDTWKYYATKSNRVHPELPLVTCCHNYAINYKIHYECNWCKTRVGRYTRSLNTKRFFCFVCKGPLILLPLTRKDGTPIKPYVRPFGKYVQENYRMVLQETAGLSHGDVMKKLSKNYAASKQNKNP